MSQQILQVDQAMLETTLDRMVRKSVEEMLNAMLDAEADGIRRRTRAVGSFPDGRSALMLICARVRYVTSSEWSTRRYLDMSRLGKTELITATGTSEDQSAQNFGHYHGVEYVVMDAGWFDNKPFSEGTRFGA